MSNLWMRPVSVVAGCLAWLAGAGCMPPAVVDAPAAMLEVRPTIIDADASPLDRKLAVVVQFFQAGNMVELGDATAVTCNGVALSWTGLGYAERVPVVAAGGQLVIEHQRAGVTTQVAVTVPPRPVVTSPASAASLPRSAALVVQYVAATSEGVRPGASDSVTGLAGTEQPDTGTATLDATTLHAGAGTISVTRRYVTTPGSGFGAVRAEYSISSVATHVTWQ